MPAPIAIKHAQNLPRRMNPGGVVEEHLHEAAGLRNHKVSMLAYSDIDYLVQGTAITAASVASFTSITASPVNATFRNNVLPFPCTPVITYTRTGTTTGQKMRFRVTGINQFGEPVQETTPYVTLAQAAYGNALIAYPTAYIYLSRVFAVVSDVEIEISGAEANADLIAVGFSAAFDRCMGSAVLFHDGASGTYTLDLQIPGGAKQTTAAIQWDATAADMETALEALAGVNDVSVQSATVGGNTIYAIKFNDPHFDYLDLTVNTNSLGGGATITITGDERFGIDNLGIGLPFRVQPAFGLGKKPPVGYAGLRVPEILGVSLSRDHARLAGSTIAFTSNDTANPCTLTLGADIGLATGEKLLVAVDSSDSNLNGTWRGEVLGDRSVKLWLNAAPAASDPGNITFLTVKAAELAALEECPLDSSGNPTDSGYRVGVSAAGWDGDPNKLQIYLDSSGDASTAARPLGLYGNFRLTPLLGIDGGDAFRLDLNLRTLIGTGRPPTAVQNYPRG